MAQILIKKLRCFPVGNCQTVLNPLNYFGYNHYYCKKINYFVKEMKSALVLIVEGSEEMEFTISADVLRRAGVS